MSTPLKYIFSITLLVVLNKSFAQKTILNTSDICETLTEMVKKDQDIRSKIPDDFHKDDGTYSKKEIDSMKIIRTKIDKFNTEKLIELTNEYGWISGERIDCPNLRTWLIFRHSDPKYFDEITELIDKEHNAKRLGDWPYKLIKNHLEGRPH
ncbi:hypothetical protein [Winogradskyella sp. PE311]|uniref:hypothetical protein n=1 Tax=Winogradskyella sp. PE311 TaxID=3366943 RepID=UPI00397EBC55